HPPPREPGRPAAARGVVPVAAGKGAALDQGREAMRKLILLAALGTALGAAGSAGAATWTVFAGPPTKAPATVPANASFHDFYPELLRVEVGDQVTFATTDFHTVTFLGTHPRSEFLLVVTTPRKYKPLRDPVRK